MTPVIKARAIPSKNGDEIGQYSQYLDHITTILSKMDANRLFPEIMGESIPMRKVFSQITKVAPSQTTVLIQGESGTGKELVARSIYEQSTRHNKPFIKFNCVAIPETLLENELFGFEKGAFAGALKTTRGKFEMADEGTIFLDEIGDMPLSTQAKILRVIQEKEFERIGGKQSIKTNVRFIAVTHKNLEQAVSNGAFRQDLFYRLNAFSIYIPPLRDRDDDISLLIDHFMKQQARSISISSQAYNILKTYHWPGNVRELKNTLERAVLMADKGIIEVSHLPPAIIHLPVENSLPGNKPSDLPLEEQIKGLEIQLIMDALDQTEGVQIKAAQMLGINQRSLWHRIKKYNIDVTRFKN